MNARPNIVLVHGAWADGSCWSGVIERLQADGYHVTAPQFPLTSLADDVARLRQVLDLPGRPDHRRRALLRRPGHHRAGRGRAERRRPGLHRGVRPRPGRITRRAAVAGTRDPGAGAPVHRRAGLRLAARRRLRQPLRRRRQPGPGEGDVRRAAAAGQSAFGDVMGVPAWKTLPSWYLVATDDEAIPPDAERLFAAGWAPPPSRSPPATSRWSPTPARSPSSSRPRRSRTGQELDRLALASLEQGRAGPRSLGPARLTVVPGTEVRGRLDPAGSHGQIATTDELKGLPGSRGSESTRSTRPPHVSQTCTVAVAVPVVWGRVVNGAFVVPLNTRPSGAGLAGNCAYPGMTHRDEPNVRRLIKPRRSNIMEFGSAAGWWTPCRSSCSAWRVLISGDAPDRRARRARSPGCG